MFYPTCLWIFEVLSILEGTCSKVFTAIIKTLGIFLTYY